MSDSNCAWSDGSEKDGGLLTTSLLAPKPPEPAPPAVDPPEVVASAGGKESDLDEGEWWLDEEGIRGREGWASWGEGGMEVDIECGGGREGGEDIEWEVGEDWWLEREAAATARLSSSCKQKMTAQFWNPKKMFFWHILTISGVLAGISLT